MQIGRRIQRLERARHAHQITDVITQEDTRMNLDARYEVPNTRNDPVNIYNFVRAHRGDPAIMVSLPFEL
jgi:hypothetical protein